MPLVLLRRPLLGLVAVALCVTALVAIAAIAGGNFGELEARVVLSTTALAVYGLLALPAGLLFERGHKRLLAGANASLSAAAFVVALVALWSSLGEGPGPFTWKTLLVLSLFAVATAQAAAVELRRRPTDPPSLRALVWIAAAAGYGDAALGSVAGILEISDSGYYRLLGAIAVVDALMLALLPIVRRAARFAVSTFRVVVASEGGRRVERDIRARDFAAAAAIAIRGAEAEGQRVTSVTRS
jgi:hypothetical protein